MNLKKLIKTISILIFVIFINCNGQSKSEIKYDGVYSINVEMEATTTGMSSKTYTFNIKKDKAILSLNSYHEPLSCEGDYKIIEDKNFIELKYEGSEQICLKSLNYKIKEKNKFFYIMGVGGEGTNKEWLPLSKKK